MSRRDPEAWNPRDRDYRRGYCQGRAARRRCWWPLLILPACIALALLGAVLFGAWST